VDNPGFEQGSQEKFATSYENSWVYFRIMDGPDCGIVEETARGGERCYRFSLGKKSRAFLHSRPFEVEPGEKYTLRGWVRTKNAASDSVFLRVFWYKDRIGVPAGEGKDRYAQTEKIGGSNGWTKLQTTVQAPQEATVAYVRLESNGGNLEQGGDKLCFKTEKPATVWFDDVAVMEK
jgi:hypothetical protein